MNNLYDQNRSENKINTDRISEKKMAYIQIPILAPVNPVPKPEVIFLPAVVYRPRQNQFNQHLRSRSRSL